MLEPLAHFNQKFGIRTDLIEDMVAGHKYVAVLLKNGHIGVCALSFPDQSLTIDDMAQPDLTSMSHRAAATAYFNAFFNYGQTYPGQIDIFDAVDFKKFKKIVMIGFFGSLAEKLKEASIKPAIFDLKKQQKDLTGMDQQSEYLALADAVILTATSISNNSFTGIVNSTPENCRIYTLGPSTTLHPDMFAYPNIHGIFGSVFRKNDEELLKIIANGGGTRSFLHLMQKVYIEKPLNQMS